MRRNSVRKFIHALVDLLPLFIIPIFAININQKSVEPISIEVQEKISVDFNQLLDQSTWDVSGTYEGITITKNNEGSIDINGTTTGRAVYYFYRTNSKFQSITNHKYMFKLNNNVITGISYGWYMGGWQGTYDTEITTAIGETNQYFYLAITSGTTIENLTITPMIFDLTQMYGEGNEPTQDEFLSTFDNAFYPYTESQGILVDKPSPTTYDDTDIGSQFLYSLYKPINDYFNFNNLFNMNDVWNWIQLNLFQGTAPLPVFMVWNIMIYEFFVDLLFLLYAVFMFIIDWSTGLIDKFLGRSRT